MGKTQVNSSLKKCNSSFGKNISQFQFWKNISQFQFEKMQFQFGKNISHFQFGKNISQFQFWKIANWVSKRSCFFVFFFFYRKFKTPEDRKEFDNEFQKILKTVNLIVKLVFQNKTASTDLTKLMNEELYAHKTYQKKALSKLLDENREGLFLKDTPFEIWTGK